MRRKPWSLAKLHRACHSAPVVWLALQELADARGSARVTPTRAELCKLTGIRKPDTVSKALTALRKAAWIEIDHVPVSKAGKRTATLLRVVLRRDTTDRFRKHRKRGPTGPRAVCTEKRGNSRPRKTGQDSLLQREGASPPPLSGGTDTPGCTSEDNGASRNGRLTPIPEIIGGLPRG